MAIGRWGYRTAGIAMAHAIYHHDLRKNLLVGPGDGRQGPQTGQDMAPGYIDPAAYELFAQVTGEARWQHVLRTHLPWLQNVRAHPTTNSFPIGKRCRATLWCRRTLAPHARQAPSTKMSYPIPCGSLNGSQSGSSPLANTLAHFLSTAPLSDGYTLAGKPLSSGYTNLPFLTGTAILTTVEDPQSAASHADLAQWLTQLANSYYGATLKALGLFIMADPALPTPFHATLPYRTVPSTIVAHTPFPVHVSPIPRGLDESRSFSWARANNCTRTPSSRSPHRRAKPPYN